VIAHFDNNAPSEESEFPVKRAASPAFVKISSAEQEKKLCETEFIKIISAF